MRRRENVLQSERRKKGTWLLSLSLSLSLSPRLCISLCLFLSLCLSLSCASAGKTMVAAFNVDNNFGFKNDSAANLILILTRCRSLPCKEWLESLSTLTLAQLS